jgi:hypothetical protein
MAIRTGSNRTARQDAIGRVEKRADHQQENERQPGMFARLLRRKPQNKDLYRRRGNHYRDRLSEFAWALACIDHKF